jgi:hypothetical protein
MAMQSIRVGVNFPHGTDWIQNYFVVEASDPIVNMWDTICPDISLIAQQLPWAILSVVRGGRADLAPDSCPIILVGAPAESSQSWHAKAAGIYSICIKSGLENVRVLFEAVLYPLTALVPLDDSMSVILDSVETGTNAPMGSSFGPIQLGVSASLGGTVKLQWKDEKKTSALQLSVFHAFSELVSPGMLLSALYYQYLCITTEEQDNGWDRSSAKKDIEVKMPSQIDAAKFKTVNDEHIQQLEQMIETNNDRFGWTRDERYRARITKMREEQAKSRELLEKLARHTGSNRGHGHLEYASGFKRGLDWSLSSFANRKMINEPPERETVAAAGTRCFDGPEEKRFFNVLGRYNPLVECEVFSSPVPDTFVLKRGRTTNVTIGKVSVIQSEFFHGFHFKLRAIAPGRSSQFALPGDSGAWVLNLFGEWVGSVTAIHSPPTGGPGISCMLESERIIADIETFTKAKVLSPARHLEPSIGLVEQSQPRTRSPAKRSTEGINQGTTKKRKGV